MMCSLLMIVGQRRQQLFMRDVFFCYLILYMRDAVD